MLAHEAHDPGGKSTFPLPHGMRGGAEFSPCGRYRPKLSREWHPADFLSYALFCGLNPSTAGGDVNDPTVIREVGFTKRIGLSAYVKVNISAYRATDPKALLALPRAELIWPDNLRIIREAAADATVIIMAYGAVHKKLRPLAAEIVAALKADGRELWCLGKTADGSPRHPLYLKSDAPLVRFDA